LVACDGDLGHAEAGERFVVHGDQALAGFGEGGHGRRKGDVVAGRGAVGGVVCEGGGGGDEKVGEFDVGEFRGGGLGGGQLAIVTGKEGEGVGVVRVHVCDDAGFEGVRREVRRVCGRGGGGHGASCDGGGRGLGRRYFECYGESEKMRGSNAIPGNCQAFSFGCLKSSPL
jgi:hypothetical protein